MDRRGIRRPLRAGPRDRLVRVLPRLRTATAQTTVEFRALSEELGQAAVTSTIQESGLGPSLEETFTVDCASLVLTGEDPSPAEWSKLRHSAYGNIAAMAGYMATPEAGELYLDGSVEKLTFARTTSCHLVAQRRGVLCIVTFSIEAVATAQR